MLSQIAETTRRRETPPRGVSQLGRQSILASPRLHHRWSPFPAAKHVPMESNYDVSGILYTRVFESVASRDSCEDGCLRVLSPWRQHGDTPESIITLGRGGEGTAHPFYPHKINTECDSGPFAVE